MHVIDRGCIGLLPERAKKEGDLTYMGLLRKDRNWYYMYGCGPGSARDIMIWCA